MTITPERSSLEAFNERSLARILKHIAPSERDQAVGTVRRADRVAARMNQVFEKHADRWIDRSFERLMRTSETCNPSLIPKGATSSKKSELRAQAARLVYGRHAKRLARLQMRTERQLKQMRDPKRAFSKAIGLG